MDCLLQLIELQHIRIPFTPPEIPYEVPLRPEFMIQKKSNLNSISSEIL